MDLVIKSKNKSILEIIKRDFITDWKCFIIILISSLVFHLILWKSWPLYSGADASTYIYYFLDFFNPQPVFQNLMCFRTPIAPFFYGINLSLGGSLLTSVILEFIALTATIMVYLITLAWGKMTSRVAVIIFVLMVPYQLQFHQVGSDAIFSWLALVFIFLIRYITEYESQFLWIILGIVLSLLTLTRPGGIAFLAIIIFTPFLKVNWKKKLKNVSLFLLSIIIILGSYVIYKGVRYDDYSIARGFGHTLSYRVFVIQDNTIKSENGPASKELINIIENNILTTEVYKEYEVTLHDFLSYKPNSRFHGDLISAVDQYKGWNSNYNILLQMSLESIRANPGIYFEKYMKDVGGLLLKNPEIPDDIIANVLATDKILNDSGLPLPTEGQMIPYSNHWWMSTRSDGTFATEKEVNEFKGKAESLIKYFRNNTGSIGIKTIFNKFWRYLNIPIAFFWIFGFLGLICSRGVKRIFLMILPLLVLVYILENLLGAPSWLKYRLTLDSYIMIFGVLGAVTFMKFIIKKINRVKPNL